MPADFKRLGKYLDQGFSWPQLMEIGWGMEHGLTDEQIDIYAKNSQSYEQMRAYREALERGASTEKASTLSQMDKLYDWEIKELLDPRRKEAPQGDQSVAQKSTSNMDYWKQQQVRYAMRERIDLTPYLVAENFDWRQLKEIRLGKQLKLDTSLYADPRIDASEMRARREALEKQINIAPYLQNGEHFDKAQIREIRRGVVARLPVSVYAKPAFSAPQMREIRSGLQQGLDLDVVRQYADPNLSWEKMREVYQRLEVREHNEEEEDEWEM